MLISIFFISCKKDGYDANVDFQYPFKIEIKSINTNDFQKEFPLSISIFDDSEYTNPNEQYTLKFETDGDGHIVDSKGKFYTSNQIMSFTYSDGTPLKIQYVPITKGKQTLNITVTNSQNYSITEKVMLDIPDRIVIKSLDYIINMEGESNKSLIADNRYFQKNNTLSYLSPNIELEVSSPKVQVKFSDKINSLNYIVYNNVSYKVNEWITVDSDKLNSIRIYSKDSNYGDEEIVLNIKDSYDNETIPATTKFRYFTYVSWVDKKPFYTYYIVNCSQYPTNRPLASKRGFYYDDIQNLTAINFKGNGSRIANINVHIIIAKAFNSNNWIQMDVSSNYLVEQVLFDEAKSTGNIQDNYVLQNLDLPHCIYRISIKDEFGIETEFSGEEYHNSFLRITNKQ